MNVIFLCVTHWSLSAWKKTAGKKQAQTSSVHFINNHISGNSEEYGYAKLHIPAITADLQGFKKNSKATDNWATASSLKKRDKT